MLKKNKSIKIPEGQLSSVSVYLMQGAEKKLYCQNLCLLAKFFIDHKVLYYGINDYEYFVLTEDRYV